ncbi:hypothetical protein [Duganella levis]|uniref:Gel scht n=1 Tax=Duganella levis TaxID=2692169 RepID=A0ABW9VVU0_9BURK|nr:hypothetical protein [Duganella levis]MYN25692.1 hypothetical protein [Duganella levis]
MKVFDLSLAAVALCFSVASVSAQQQALSAATAPGPIESVSVTARRFHMEPRDFEAFEYEYVLNNGDIVRFSRRVGRFYVGLRGKPTVEIFPTTADQFVTKGGARLIFTEGGDALNIDHYETLQASFGIPVATAPAAPK